jgi:replication factor A1
MFDLRLKAVLLDSVPDNPPQSHDLVINAGLVEKLTGISLKKAIDLASEALDTAVVADYLSEKVLFRYYEVTGAQLSSNFLVEEIVPVNGLAKQIAIETMKLISGIAGGI